MTQTPIEPKKQGLVFMISSAPRRRCDGGGVPKKRSSELDEVLQSLRLVLEMEPDHIDGAIDLLDTAIDIDQQRTRRPPAGQFVNRSSPNERKN